MNIYHHVEHYSCVSIHAWAWACLCVGSLSPFAHEVCVKYAWNNLYTEVCIPAVPCTCVCTCTCIGADRDLPSLPCLPPEICSENVASALSYIHKFDKSENKDNILLAVAITAIQVLGTKQKAKRHHKMVDPPHTTKAKGTWILSPPGEGSVMVGECFHRYFWLTREPFVQVKHLTEHKWSL